MTENNMLIKSIDAANLNETYKYANVLKWSAEIKLF